MSYCLTGPPSGEWILNYSITWPRDPPRTEHTTVYWLPHFGACEWFILQLLEGLRPGADLHEIYAIDPQGERHKIE